jgi:hypothetical protein
MAVETDTLHGCLLDQPNLDLLIRAVRKDLGPIELHAIWRGTHVRVNALSTLQNRLDSGLTPGNTHMLEALQLQASAGGNIVQVHANQDRVEVRVESSDAAWAIGRKQQIRQILLHSHGSLHSERLSPGWAALSGIAFAAAAAALAFFLGWLHPTPITNAAVSAFVLGSASMGYLLGRRRREQSKTVIWLGGSLPKRSWRSWSRSDRIAAATCLISGLSLLMYVLAIYLGR